MNGILNLNKPQGMTSHKAVSIARKLTGIRKIGHTGTLDPMVSGVLPLCIGNATRLVEYMDTDYKTYAGQLTLGIKTDTQDIWGTVLAENKPTADSLTEEEIRNGFSHFLGDIMQTPPAYSAVKVDGKRLYEYARAGETVEVKSRKVHIKRLEIKCIEGTKVDFEVECSKGTYIRTICNDIGDLIGCGGTMSALTRTKSGVFLLEDTVTIEELEKMSETGDFNLLPMDFPLAGMDSFDIIREDAARVFRNGGFLDTHEVSRLKGFKTGDGSLSCDGKPQFYRAYYNGEFIAVAEYLSEIQKLKAHKVFVR